MEGYVCLITPFLQSNELEQESYGARNNEKQGKGGH